MTVKSALRLLLGCVIVWFALSFALPMGGIARSRMLPPPLAYAGSATKKADGYVTGKHTDPSGNPFKSTESVYLVDYQFRAPVPAGPGNPAPKPASTVYLGRVNVAQEYYSSAAKGQVVPVKYDPTDPEISGINLAGAGQNGLGHGFILNIWILVFLATIVLGYFLSPWLERIILRENY